MVKSSDPYDSFSLSTQCRMELAELKMMLIHGLFCILVNGETLSSICGIIILPSVSTSFPNRWCKSISGS